MTNNQEDFRRHLTQLGFELGAPQAQVMTKLRRLMGEERFAQFHQLIGVINSAKNPDARNGTYEFVRGMAEANLLRSLATDVTVDASYPLYEMCRPLLVPGKRVLELGCWTGGLTSFIAIHHPRCHVVGVDRVEHVIALNRAQHKLSNVNFNCWDYRHSKPPEIVPADILLCGLGINEVPLADYEEANIDSVRDSAGYRRQKDEFAIYLRNWREATIDGGSLLAVLSVGTFGRFVAILDAALEMGWKPEISKWTTIMIHRGKRPLLCMTFTATKSHRFDEDVALSHFVRLTNVGSCYVRLIGGLALAVFRSIKNKQILTNQTFRDERGLVASEEVGVAASFGYVFRRDATPDYRFAIISLDAAQSNNGKLFDWPPLTQAAPSARRPGAYVVTASAQSGSSLRGFSTSGGE